MQVYSSKGDVDTVYVTHGFNPISTSTSCVVDLCQWIRIMAR